VSTDWQARFQELAVHQQEDANRFAEAERILCRTIVRLCAAGAGFDPVLDPHLERIKAAVRNGYSADLAQRLNDLGDALVSATAQTGGVELVERLAQRLSLPLKSEKQLRGAWQAVARDPAGASDAALDEILLLLGLAPATDPSGEKAGGKRGGLFGRLLKGTAGGSPNAVLAGLLSRIAWPDALSAEIEELREGLAASAPEDAWVEVVERLSGMVVSVLQDAQAQVAVAEAFLTELTERLGAIEAHVSREAGDRDAAQARGAELSAAVQGEVDDMSVSLRDSTDLAQLKGVLSLSLDRLQQHVERFLSADRLRHDEAVLREAALREELVRLERESQALREQVNRSRDQANTDPLTGLPNRRAWDGRVADEVARFRRFGAPLSLVVFDLDNFKQINDRFGHKAGDRALKVIATLLRQRLRETDFLARYGGEEFTILLPGASGDAAARLADGMREAVAQAGLHSKGEPVPLTLSGGVTCLREGESADAAFERADQAMYQAKAAGKNRIVLD
jgi:diguanylate cyclase